MLPPNAPIRVELLGAFRVLAGERTVTRFTTYKTGALLAYLTYHSQQVTSREKLIDIFWPDGTPERGRNNLSFALSSLRSQLTFPNAVSGAVIVADRHSIGLNAQAIQTDLTAFTQAIALMEKDDTQDVSTSLLEAVTLYRGELLPGYYEDWILPERERLRELYVQALRRLVRLAIGRKEFFNALDYAQRAIAAAPLREELHRDTIRLFLATGQPSAALEQYRSLEKTLRDSISAVPAAASRQLLHEIEAACAAIPPSTRAAPVCAPAASPAAAESDLPVPAPPPGVVTFLLTDIVGSTAQWEKNGTVFRQALAQHHALLRRLFAQHHGYAFKSVGDGFLVAFDDAHRATLCAVALQRALLAHIWPVALETVLVRTALMTGEVEWEAGDYVGLTLHRASRVLSATHGSQILCAEPTARTIARQSGEAYTLTDLGVYRLRDIPPQRLYQIDYEGMSPREFPPPYAESGFQSVIPPTFTQFFGRTEEMRRLSALLQNPGVRLVTLSGIGGTGKTRLALEVSRTLSEWFHGAVWFVSLADVTDARLIPDTIAATMRLPVAQHDRLEQVIEALAAQPSLLILDNYEQLVEAGTGTVRTLLERLPTLTCLITSRRLLALEGEREFFVTPLPTPPRALPPESLLQYESVQMFVDRAQGTRPDFQITSGNAGAVAALCVGLEGIPLALELAAARIQVMSPAQMALQLQHRFDFLVSRRRDVTERHRTLRQALDWSYHLLSPELQRLLTRLSVFHGGWNAEAAETVCQEPLALDCLAQLRESSLILAEEAGESIRFRLLETVREYAAEKLADAGAQAAFAAQHGDYYREVLVRESGKLQGAGLEAAEAVAILNADLDNIRAGMDFAVRHERDRDIVEYGLALILFLRRRSLYAECEVRLAQAEAAAHRVVNKAALAYFLNLHGLIDWDRSNYDKAEPCFEAARCLCREIGEMVLLLKVLANLGNIAWGRSDFAKARQIWEEALELAVAGGHTRQEGTYRANLAMLACYLGDYDRSERYYQEGLALYQRVKFEEGVAYTRYNYSELLLSRREFVRAQAEAEESLRLFTALADSQGMALATVRIGLLHLETGKNAEAREILAEGLAKAEEIGARRCEMYACEGMARLAHREIDLPQAQALYGRSLRIASEIGDQRQFALTLVRQASVLSEQNQQAEAYTLLVWAVEEHAKLELADTAEAREQRKHLELQLGPQANRLAAEARGQKRERILEILCHN